MKPISVLSITRANAKTFGNFWIAKNSRIPEYTGQNSNSLLLCKRVLYAVVVVASYYTDDWRMRCGKSIHRSLGLARIWVHTYISVRIGVTSKQIESCSRVRYELVRWCYEVFIRRGRGQFYLGEARVNHSCVKVVHRNNLKTSECVLAFFAWGLGPCYATTNLYDKN